MKKFFSLIAAIFFAAGMMAETYTKTAYASLQTGDVVIITMQKGENVYAASNDQGTSRPPVATAVTVAEDAITTEATNILWTVVKDGDNISFQTGDNYLYCTNTNNGVRVGTNENNVFSIDAESGYLYNNATSRFIGVYNNADWRCYTSVNSNITGQTLAFFAAAGGGVTPPVEQGCNWDEIAFLGNGSGNAAYTDRFKVCAGDPAPTSIVNIQAPGWAAEAGIYVTFPSAAFGAISLEDGQYAIDGAGMVLYASAFLYEAEKEVTIVCQEVTYTLTIKNANPETAPAVPITCAAVYSLEKNAEVALNDVVVTHVNGRNVWVKDESAAMLLYLSADATWSAGDVLSGVAGVVDIFKGLYEVKPSADQVAAIVATPGEAPAAEELAVIDEATDMNKYIVLKNVAVSGAFENNKLTMTVGENTYELYNKFNSNYAFDATKTYNITGIVSIYNTLQVLFINAEEAAAPVADEWVEIKFVAAATADEIDADASFTVDGFTVAITDPDNKMSIDANDCRFGIATDYKMYSHRLKSGGKSSATKNFITLTIPEAGTLRIAVRTGKNADTDRNLVIKQGDDTLYNQVIVETMAVKVMEGETEVSVYPFVEVPVEAGTVALSYPVNGLNFYAFAFKADGGETPEPVLPSIALIGEMNSWDGSQGAFVVADDKLSASLTLNLAEMPQANGYAFKLLVDGVAYGSERVEGNPFTFTRENNVLSPVDHIAAGDDEIFWLVMDATGDYTFTYTFADSSLMITYPALAPVEHTYTVAGGSAELFGTTWAPANTANDMVKQEDGTYKWEKTEVTLPAGNVEFKVCEDHAWDNCWPAQNYQLVIPEAGVYTITITYNPEGNVVAGDAVKTGDAVVDPVVSIAGSMNSWNASADVMVLAEDKATASLTLNLAAQTYEFKVVINGGDWRSNAHEFTRENATAAEMTGNLDNMHLVADVAGEYVFTWTFATNTLVITYPNAGPEPLIIPEDAPVPTVAEDDVMAIYCNHYANNNANFGISGWAGGYQTLDLNGINVGYWTGMTWECIIDPAHTDDAHDFSAYKNLHVDLWAPLPAKIKFTAEAVAGGNYKDGMVVEMQQGWNNVDFVVADWAGNYDFKNLKCFVFEQYQTLEGASFEGNPFAFANIYFYGKEAQGIDNTNVEMNAVKFIENGQLIILKNGVKYNVMGVIVR